MGLKLLAHYTKALFYVRLFCAPFFVFTPLAVTPLLSVRSLIFGLNDLCLVYSYLFKSFLWECYF